MCKKFIEERKEKKMKKQCLIYKPSLHTYRSPRNYLVPHWGRQRSFYDPRYRSCPSTTLVASVPPFMPPLVVPPTEKRQGEAGSEA
jgi:hypothetical protein